MTATELVNALRVEAEKAIGSVTTTLSTAYGRSSLARLVQTFYNTLTSAGNRLVKMQQAIVVEHAKRPTAGTAAALEQANKLLVYWTALAQGFSTYVRPATPDERQRLDALGSDEVGNPVALVAGAVVVVAVVGAASVVAVSVTGIAWAVVHYEQAGALQKEVDLLAANPAMADALIRLNESQPTTTLPGGDGDGISAGTVAAGVLGLGALFGLGYMIMKKKG